MEPVNSTKFEILENSTDIEYSKPSKSKFLFYLGFFGFFLFTLGCGYGLWSRGYRSTANQEVPASTTYNPTYK